MNYTFEEAVRELSDFLGKNTTATDYFKMEQVLLTVLEETREGYDRGYDCGYKDGLNDGESLEDDYYNQGYNQGFEDGYDSGYSEGVVEERDSWMCK